jgi:branched-chain amino acid transport system substrate-binding protein
MGYKPAHQGDVMKIAIAAWCALTCLCMAAPASAENPNYGPGVTDTEVKIGQTMPYSGAASSFATIGRAIAAYFQKVNAEGGVNGRKINLISLDDGHSPPKAVEQTRRLVESDEVFAIVGTFGSPTNFAIQKYLNSKKVPSLFLGTGANRVSEPATYPWSMGWQPNSHAKGVIYAKYVIKAKPNARVAVLYQNDDFGRDYAKGFRDGLGEKAGSMIVKELSYELTEPTVDSEILQLKATALTSCSICRRQNLPRRPSSAWRKPSGTRCTSSAMPPVRLPAPSSPLGWRIRKASSPSPSGKIRTIRSGRTIPA